MDEVTYLKKMNDAVKNPRIQCLFMEILLRPRQDRHINEVYNGFEILKEFIEAQNIDLLERAYRSFDYVTNQDLKYVRTLSYLGKALVAAYYQKGTWFKQAYSYLDKIINMTLWSADNQRFIEEIQTECRHLKEDIMERDRELYPFGATFRSLFC